MLTDKFKELLLKRQKQVTHQLEELREDDPAKDIDRLTDNADIGTEAGEQERHVRTDSLVRDQSRALDKIKKALAKIGIGKFGICEKCGRPIDKARLEIYPSADLCFDCERKLEL